MLKNRLLPLFLLVVCVFSLFTGCTINIDIDSSAKDATTKTDSKTIFDYIFNGKEETTMYESRATIYISTTAASTDTAISSSDLTVSERLVKTYIIIFESDPVQARIRAEYPDTEYTLSLESMYDANVFALIATSESPEQLEEICNTAASVFCETLTSIIQNASCKVVDTASPAHLVRTN